MRRTADIRGRQYRCCAQHGFVGAVSLQAAANARDFRGVRRDAFPPRPTGPGARGVTKALRELALQTESSQTLDPQNWDDVRAQGHRMLDDMLDYAANIRHRPGWSPIPNEVPARFHTTHPLMPSDLNTLIHDFH